jgi:hypothetical protein
MLEQLLDFAQHFKFFYSDMIFEPQDLAECKVFECLFYFIGAVQAVRFVIFRCFHTS